MTGRTVVEGAMVAKASSSSQGHTVSRMVATEDSRMKDIEVSNSVSRMAATEASSMVAIEARDRRIARGDALITFRDVLSRTERHSGCLETARRVQMQRCMYTRRMGRALH